jgi:hypothetical protein
MRLREQLKSLLILTQARASAPLAPASSHPLCGPNERVRGEEMCVAPVIRPQDTLDSNPIRRWRWE